MEFSPSPSRVEASVLPNEGEVYTYIYLYLVFSIILMIVIIIIVDYMLWVIGCGL